jgi:hypothetical protein
MRPAICAGPFKKSGVTNRPTVSASCSDNPSRNLVLNRGVDVEAQRLPVSQFIGGVLNSGIGGEDLGAAAEPVIPVRQVRVCSPGGDGGGHLLLPFGVATRQLLHVYCMPTDTQT